jgi:hypothetical protein
MHGPCKAGGSGTDILVATILRPLWRTAVTRVAEEQVSRTFYRQVAARCAWGARAPSLVFSCSPSRRQDNTVWTEPVKSYRWPSPTGFAQSTPARSTRGPMRVLNIMQHYPSNLKRRSDTAVRGALPSRQRLWTSFLFYRPLLRVKATQSSALTVSTGALIQCFTRPCDVNACSRQVQGYESSRV